MKTSWENTQPEESPKLNAEGIAAFIEGIKQTPGYKSNPVLQQYFAAHVIPHLGFSEIDEETAFAIVEDVWDIICKVHGRVAKANVARLVN
jgi:hypothetical protein